MGIYQGLQLRITGSTSGQEHWHSEIELLFAVEGQVRVTVQGNGCLLSSEDILLINSSQLHSVVCQDGAILCCVKFPWRMVSDLLESSSFIFRCSSVDDQSRPYHDLRGILRGLVYTYVRERRRTSCLVESQLLRLLDCLVEHYLVELGADSGGHLSDEARLQRIFQFVNRNYQESVALSHLAEELFVSPSTLSRFFKKQTGMGFVDYLNQVRLHAAAIELERTDENITKIAVNSGFSNLSVLNRLFREAYGMSPTEYRRQRRDAVRQEQGSERECLETLREQLGGQELPAPETAAHAERKRRVAVQVDGTAGEPYRKNWNQVINIGPASQLTQANLQSHLLTLAEQLGFTHARVWNLFAQGLMITDGKRTGGYYYDILDSVLDFLVSNHIHPYLDFGCRPDTITKNEGETVLQTREYIPFQSRRAWEHLVRDFIHHIVQRYGRAEVGQWYFELTYLGGPDDDCYTDPHAPFRLIDAFQCLYAAVKEYLPDAPVGGFGTIADYRVPFQRQFLADCTERGCVPDFYSIIGYPYYSRDEEAFPLPHRSSEPDWVRKQVARARQLLEDAGLERCRLFVCEWNNTFSNRNFLNDSCYRSAYFAQNLSKLWDSVDLVAPSVGSDWLGSHFDAYRVVNGNMGLLSPSNIRKPVFFALHFMNMLGDRCIDRGENYMVTRTQHGSFYILCFNQKRFNSNYYLMEEGASPPDRLRDLFEDRDPIDLTFTLENLPQGTTYMVKTRRINESEGSILGEWGKFQFEGYLDAGDLQYLRETCFPRLSMEKVATQGGRLQLTETVQANEVVLLHIYARN